MRKREGNRVYRNASGGILVLLLMGFLQSHWRQTNIGCVNTASAAEDQPDLAATAVPIQIEAAGSKGLVMADAVHFRPRAITLPQTKRSANTLDPTRTDRPTY